MTGCCRPAGHSALVVVVVVVCVPARCGMGLTPHTVERTRRRSAAVRGCRRRLRRRACRTCPLPRRMARSTRLTSITGQPTASIVPSASARRSCAGHRSGSTGTTRWRPVRPCSSRAVLRQAAGSSGSSPSWVVAVEVAPAEAGAELVEDRDRSFGGGTASWSCLVASRLWGRHSRRPLNWVVLPPLVWATMWSMSHPSTWTSHPDGCWQRRSWTWIARVTVR